MTAKEFHRDIHVKTSGEAMAIVYWFEFHIFEGSGLFSTRDIESHYNQVAFMLEQNKHVVQGDCIKFSGKFSDAGFMFRIE